MLQNREVLEAVNITLPKGEVVSFQLMGQVFDDSSASCFVVKDAGSDPDVTNGAEIHASVSFTPDISLADKQNFIIAGGEGIGRVTKPGLALPVGEWAINPVPRKMIEAALRDAFPCPHSPGSIHCLISIPNGAELAKKTLNERLGIVGGLSILGTTGIVTPVSANAWTDTIDTAIDVALASGSRTVVLSTGRTSELAVQRHLGARGKGQGAREALPEEAFVMMGDYVGHALRNCAAKRVQQVILSGQFAKLLKIACGHEQTHVSSSTLDLQQLAEWLRIEPGTSDVESLARRANTARQLVEESGRNQTLLRLVCNRARAAARQFATGVTVQVLLVGYNTEVIYST